MGSWLDFIDRNLLYLAIVELAAWMIVGFVVRIRRRRRSK